MSDGAGDEAVAPPEVLVRVQPIGKAPAASVPILMRSIADEISALEEMRQRGIISDDEFTQGKTQVLAWPVSSPIPPALSPQRVWADGRRTWASYQPATRAAFADLAQRHGLEVRWRDDVPFEVVCTYPVQPRLSLKFTLALEKGAIHCWGERDGSLRVPRSVVPTRGCLAIWTRRWMP